MYFTEKGLLESKSHEITVKLTLLSGSEVTVSIPHSYTVCKLKEEGVEVLEVVSKDKVCKSSNYNLVNVRSGVMLADDDVISNVINQCDELILLPRHVKSSWNESERDVSPEGTRINNRAPTNAEILLATSKTKRINPDRQPDENLKSLEFNSELQKILVTFVETSLKLLALDPQAETVLREIEAKLSVVIKPVEHLKSLGYTEEQVSLALTQTGNDINAAKAWLQQHNNESVNTDDVEMRDVMSNNTHHTEFLPRYNIPVSASEILKAFKAFQRKKFKPDEDALKHFRDMGFEEISILDALRETGNNEDMACDLLLGESITSSVETSPGLEPNSPIYKAIMCNPIILTHLSNPKNLSVFLNMLENIRNLRTNAWIADPDISPLFSQVFRVYHTENYTLK